jgi:hypothetical protein
MDSFFASCVIALGLLVALAAFVKGIPERRRGRVLSAAERRATLEPRRVGGGFDKSLTLDDVRRLVALRRRIPDLHGEPTAPMTLPQRWSAARRRGVIAWGAAAGAGAFSMATHFIVPWLAMGGGWVGAAVMTAASTALMTGICVVIVFRLATRG